MNGDFSKLLNWAMLIWNRIVKDLGRIPKVYLPSLICFYIMYNFMVLAPIIGSQHYFPKIVQKVIEKVYVVEHL